MCRTGQGERIRDAFPDEYLLWRMQRQRVLATGDDSNATDAMRITWALRIREELARMLKQMRAVDYAMGHRVIKSSGFDADYLKDIMSVTRAAHGRTAGASSTQVVAEWNRYRRKLREVRYAAAADRYKELLRSYLLKRRQMAIAEAQEAAQRNLEQNTRRAHNLISQRASRTGKLFSEDAEICGMVCIVMDLATGNYAFGRAGHQLSQVQLEARFGFRLPGLAASAHTVANSVNCAELQALFNLLNDHPDTVFETLYFASAIPGRRKLIPPCDNCKRWISSKNIEAWGFDKSQYKRRK